MRRAYEIGFCAEVWDGSARDRQRAISRMDEVLAKLNQRFEQELGRSIVWQDLKQTFLADLDRPDHAFDILVALGEEIWPVRLRGAVVSVSERDAPSFQSQSMCESAVESLRTAPREPGLFHVGLAGRNSAEAELAQSCARLHATICSDWTPARAEAVRAYRELGRQIAVAERLGITQQAVSQMLRGARYRELVRAEHSMRGWLRGPSRPGIWPLGSNLPQVGVSSQSA